MMEQLVVKVPSGTVRIKNGFCPNGHSLINAEKLVDGKPSLALTIRIGARKGMLYHSSYYGRFEYESEIPLKAGDMLKMLCPHCGISLTADDLCGICHVPMFEIQLPGGGQVQACRKVGCHNHTLMIVDLDAQLGRLYDDDENRIKM